MLHNAQEVNSNSMKKIYLALNITVIVHVFILLLNVKMATIVGILTYMSRIFHFRLSLT